MDDPPVKPLKNKITSFLDLDVKDLAQQLTLIEFRLFKAIPYVELTAQAWNYKGKAPTVTAYIERFNEVSYWIATEVVLCPNLKKRVNILKRFIQLAEVCNI